MINCHEKPHTLTIDDPECLILLDFVARMAQHDTKGKPIPEGVKPPTGQNVAIAALRHGLRSFARSAIGRQRFMQGLGPSGPVLETPIDPFCCG